MDRAALDVAITLGIPHGGWCPKGRLAEDGAIAQQYQLTETELPDYAQRTEQNVLDADATLILCRGQPSGGTELTRRLAERLASRTWSSTCSNPSTGPRSAPGSPTAALARSTSPALAKASRRASTPRRWSSCGSC